MSAAAVPAKHARRAITTNDFLNICDTSKRTFLRSTETELKPEAVAEQGSPRNLLRASFGWKLD
jgi:hypothetical protein